MRTRRRLAGRHPQERRRIPVGIRISDIQRGLDDRRGGKRRAPRTSVDGRRIPSSATQRSTPGLPRRFHGSEPRVAQPAVTSPSPMNAAEALFSSTFFGICEVRVRLVQVENGRPTLRLVTGSRCAFRLVLDHHYYKLDYRRLAGSSRCPFGAIKWGPALYQRRQGQPGRAVCRRRITCPSNAPPSYRSYNFASSTQSEQKR